MTGWGLELDNLQSIFQTQVILWHCDFIINSLEDWALSITLKIQNRKEWLIQRVILASGGTWTGQRNGVHEVQESEILFRWSLWCGSTTQLTGSYRKSLLQPMEGGVGAHCSEEVKWEIAMRCQVQGTIPIVQRCAAPQYPGTGSLFEAMFSLHQSWHP